MARLNALQSTGNKDGVGPSAAPIIPIDALFSDRTLSPESLLSNKATMIVKKIPNWVSPNNIFGFFNSGEKSIAISAANQHWEYFCGMPELKIFAGLWFNLINLTILNHS